jgi:hypothetical protein
MTGPRALGTIGRPAPGGMSRIHIPAGGKGSTCAGLRCQPPLRGLRSRGLGGARDSTDGTAGDQTSWTALPGLCAEHRGSRSRGLGDARNPTDGIAGDQTSWTALRILCEEPRLCAQQVAQQHLKRSQRCRQVARVRRVDVRQMNEQSSHGLNSLYERGHRLPGACWAPRPRFGRQPSGH